jgi:hypothetical protein
MAKDKKVEYELYDSGKPWCVLLHKGGLFYAADWDTNNYVEIPESTFDDYQRLYLAFVIEYDQPEPSVTVPKPGAVVTIQAEPKKAVVTRDRYGKITGIEEVPTK